MVKQLEERMKKAEENKKKLDKIALEPTIQHTAAVRRQTKSIQVTERLKNFNKIQEEVYTKNRIEYDRKSSMPRTRLSDVL